MIAAGEDKKLQRKTFLHQGVFVIQGITVRVMEQSPDGTYVVQYLDKEGHPHNLPGVREDELGPA